MSEPALEIESLSLAIRGQAILRDVSARFGVGETWSIIGANGAGKSTLLKCLMRIQNGWTGRVRVHGQELACLSQRELARHLAYVPQPGGEQRFPFTVREFVRMARYPWAGPFGAAQPGDSEVIAHALRLAEVEEFAERSLDTLSGGERQKVFFAAALAQGGNVLLLDEPTAFLDYRHQAEVAKIIHALHRERGATIVVVTHDVNAAMLMGGAVLALRDGALVWSGPARALACEQTLGLIFGATFRLLDDPVTGLRLVAPQGAGEYR